MPSTKRKAPAATSAPGLFPSKVRIVCAGFVVGPLDPAVAERRLAEIKALGACMFDHAIEPLD